MSTKAATQAVLQTIKIAGKCNAVPMKGNVHPEETLQFWTNLKSTFTIRLPGGVFVGQPNPFTVTVAGKELQPEPPLQVLPAGEITAPLPLNIGNYIYDQQGKNCIKESKDEPPEIVISS